ncbi:hypothetical protein PMAYCL1PPCAC_26303 [Pristionchus mayeri]|uniref:Uncharacterized protein n=1 Tax=Pristionchus mayeri TaxID=1317129 RepID=A0AAN5D3X7_9BILA|nr:hypothetical protein PMAYCL1PPCAC_26303 [Pristionchus mayeri]
MERSDDTLQATSALEPIGNDAFEEVIKDMEAIQLEKDSAVARANAYEESFRKIAERLELAQKQLALQKELAEKRRKVAETEHQLAMAQGLNEVKDSAKRLEEAKQRRDAKLKKRGQK